VKRESQLRQSHIKPIKLFFNNIHGFIVEAITTSLSYNH
jgi:hypothetical protein